LRTLAIISLGTTRQRPAVFAYLVKHEAAEILGGFHGAMSIDRYLRR